nr:LLM class flavin-dependent oxidoreductase [Nakamurella alba]
MTTVGISLPHDAVVGPERRAVLDRVAAAGLDGLTVGDHISFHGGTGFDGIVSATSVLAARDDLDVLIGVYLLGLRHPMLAARQIATLAELAPGRLVLGAGVGGEDRNEISNAGVDPASRGRRLDETLGLLRQLLTGAPVTHHGEFFDLVDAVIFPPPAPAVPIVIGGTSPSAIRRTAKYGDGWLGIFCSARRLAATRTEILEQAAGLGRAPDWFGVNIWCGIDPDPGRARELLAAKLEGMYRLPYEKFQYIAPAGTPEQIAEFAAAFVAGGAGHVTLIPVAGTVTDSIDLSAEVRRLLVAG